MKLKVLKTKFAISLLVMLCSTVVLFGCENASSSSVISTDEIKANIAKSMPSLPKIDQVNKSQITGLYEVVSGNNVYYVTNDGKYLVFGNIVELSSKKSMTAERRQQLTAPISQSK